MKKLAVTLAASGLFLAGAASAAPVARQADLELTISMPTVLDPTPPWWPCLPGYCPQWPYGAIRITSTGATVSVDDAAGTISIAAGAVTQTAPITIPVTETTGFSSVIASGIHNLYGVFSIGGGSLTSPTSEAPCPSGTPVAPGVACVTASASKLGGQMGFVGTILVVLVPNLVTLPISLATAGFGIGGSHAPPTYTSILFDAAPWTQGKGKVGFISKSTTYPWSTWSTQLTATGAGGTVNIPASGTITLVTPTHVSAAGLPIPVLATLEIHFVPEPGTLPLLAAALGGLALASRRR